VSPTDPRQYPRDHRQPPARRRIPPLTEKYGPNTAAVQRFLDELNLPGTWTPERVRRCRSILAAFTPAHFAARRASRREVELCQPPRERERSAAWRAAWDIAARHGTSWAAGWAADALTVRDLIDDDHFDTLTRPFADLIAAYDATENPDG
jgi:hypothetical protein